MGAVHRLVTDPGLPKTMHLLYHEFEHVQLQLTHIRTLKQDGEMSERLVYFNGDFIPERDARISILDSGIMYGDICFKLTRTFKQKPYRLQDHLDRRIPELCRDRLRLEQGRDGGGQP